MAAGFARGFAGDLGTAVPDRDDEPDPRFAAAAAAGGGLAVAEDLAAVALGFAVVLAVLDALRGVALVPVLGGVVAMLKASLFLVWGQFSP